MYPRCTAPKPGDEVAEPDDEARNLGGGHPDVIDAVADLVVGRADPDGDVPDLANGVEDLVDEVRDLVFDGDRRTIGTR